MTHANDPEEIEAGLERTRSGLASTLDELSNRASVDYIAREALGMLKINTADATHSLDRAIRANPMAFVLIGAGVAWMALGGKSSGNGANSGSYRSDGMLSDDPDPDWHSGLARLRMKARDTLGRIDTEARTSASSLKSNLSDQVEQVRDFAAERAQVIETFAADLKSAIANGLEHLSETARATVMQARQESYSALLRAERVVKGGGREAVAVVEEHPLAVGAVALAVGAVAGIAFLKAGEADRNSPAYWTGGSKGRRGSGGAAYRGSWAQGSNAGLGGQSGGQGVAPAGGMVSTGGAGLPTGGGASGSPTTGPYGGDDTRGAVPPL